jgi:hypothetical protein
MRLVLCAFVTSVMLAMNLRNCRAEQYEYVVGRSYSLVSLTACSSRDDVLGLNAVYMKEIREGRFGNGGNLQCGDNFSGQILPQYIDLSLNSNKLVPFADPRADKACPSNPEFQSAQRCRHEIRPVIWVKATIIFSNGFKTEGYVFSLINVRIVDERGIPQIRNGNG